MFITIGLNTQFVSESAGKMLLLSHPKARMADRTEAADCVLAFFSKGKSIAGNAAHDEFKKLYPNYTVRNPQTYIDKGIPL